MSRKVTGRDTETQQYIDLIDDMLLDDSYGFAHDFLQSVAQFAKRTDFISPKQKAAVNNICMAKRDQD